MFYLFYIHHTLTLLIFFFFNDTATTEIYTLSLHDALPIYDGRPHAGRRPRPGQGLAEDERAALRQHHGQHQDRGDRKSTRLNSSHLVISYAVFCLKKKKKNEYDPNTRDAMANK